MSWDLAISRYGDLIFAGNRDFAGISGTPLTEQCIRTRIKIPRGSWVYDINERIGSRVHRALTSGVDKAIQEIPIFVREALDDMDDVVVGEVQITPDESGRELNLIIGYSITTFPEGATEPSAPEVDQMIISLPL